MSSFRENELKKQWLAIGLAIFFGLSLAVYKGYYTLLPIASEYIADKIPHEIYQKIGELSLSSLDKSEFEESQLAPEKQGAIRAQLSSLIEQIGLANEFYQVEFRQWSQGSNAFALMNGTIVITDSLVEQFEQPELIGSVLLHEVGHIHHRHLMKNAIKLSMIYVSLSLIIGDASIVNDLLVESATTIFKIGLSREYEIQADTFAATHTKQPLKEALEALYQPHAHQDSFLSTHPSLEERLAHISAL